MRRRVFRKPAVTLSLFPFLAVLVCTMGALIVLLVSVLQKARVDAIEVAVSQSTQSVAEKQVIEDLRLEIQDQEWRRSELERQRSEYQQQLTKQRLTLSHFEDHIRQLEEQLKQLAAQADELKRIRSQQSSGLDESQEQLRALQAEIAQKRQQLGDAQTKAETKKPAFCIIPYDGPNGTKRRPIYIECTDQGVILQPEGVVLSPSDFAGSLGPGNPLDAALRTTREYLAKYAETKSDGEPYPLLIIRPSGTVAYAAARAALKSWDDEFGYELIEADLKLAYPKSDPALAQEIQRSIQDARDRQAVLASIMPGRFSQIGATGPRPGLVASSNGGFVTADGSPMPAMTSAPQAGGVGDGNGGGGFASTFRTTSLGPEDRAMSMEAAQRSSSQSHGGYSSSGSGKNTGTSGSGQNPGTPGGNESITGSGNANQGHLSSASQTPGAANSQKLGIANAPTGGAPGGIASGNVGNLLGLPAQSGSGVEPLANSRGAQWGLPNQSSSATGIQRYVQVECRSDCLLLLRDSYDTRSPTVIPLPGLTSAAIDSFVSALWKRMEQWGVAADGCYWKPILRVHVHPDAEQRFAELATLLKNSGLVVERKN